MLVLVGFRLITGDREWQPPGGAEMERGRWMMAAIIAVISLVSYFGYREYNPVTAEMQHVKLSAEQEIALGLKAAPELAAQHGGRSRDAAASARVRGVG